MKNILLAEDNVLVRETLAYAMQVSVPECAILKATNGREGMDILERGHVDLVLTDLEMPGADGYELIAYRNTHCPAVPLLVMTCDTSPAVLRKLSALGVTECLEKPFNYESTFRLIANKLCRRDQTAAGQPPEPCANA